MVWPGTVSAKNLLGDLQLRRRFLERLLARERGLLFGARSLRCGGLPGGGACPCPPPPRCA